MDLSDVEAAIAIALKEGVTIKGGWFAFLFILAAYGLFQLPAIIAFLLLAVALGFWLKN